MARGSSSRSHWMAGDRLGRHARAAPKRPGTAAVMVKGKETQHLFELRAPNQVPQASCQVISRAVVVTHAGTSIDGRATMLRHTVLPLDSRLFSQREAVLDNQMALRLSLLIVGKVSLYCSITRTLSNCRRALAKVSKGT
ncbi:uncharacterized protein TRIREDRAFT_109267 [Trichoderma reesei QM6a]|uniref:Predicted protein n=1 Tax=Hypocrea jecorina (strain QM6a) TaxID=431241 RepID=G0RP76_HYPJQ|nr:uncharacterized protein TRIREDRAFT_109267 [Trichoderma reesei QM6a]EGR47065.1 predicted protein [Trichoderma reesei QM6a]